MVDIVIDFSIKTFQKHKSTKGLDWGPGAVGNAVWSGARLKDVLEAAGVKPDDTKHVQVSFQHNNFLLNFNLLIVLISV